MQWATRANEAYQTLKTPWSGVTCSTWPGGTSRRRTTPPCRSIFSLAQMEWREAVAEARQGGDHHELERLRHRLQGDVAGRYDELGRLLDDARDYDGRSTARRLMFLENSLLKLTTPWRRWTNKKTWHFSDRRTGRIGTPRTQAGGRHRPGHHQFPGRFTVRSGISVVLNDAQGRPGAFDRALPPDGASEVGV